MLAGTQLSVEFILDNLAVGRTPEELFASCATLTSAGIETAKRYAIEVARRFDTESLRTPIKIRHLVVALQPQPVVNEICEAFESVCLGRGYSLKQLAAVDNYGEDRAGRSLSRQEFKQLRNQDANDWKAVKVGELLGSHYFAFSDSESFRFYIPARVVLCLAQKHGAGDVELMADLQRGPFDLLDTAQRRAIASFLWSLLGTPLAVHENRHHEVEKALHDYWIQFLDPQRL